MSARTGIARSDVGLRLICGIGVAAVAIGAAEPDRVFEMRVVGALMAGDAAGALVGRVFGALAEQVDADQFRRHRERGVGVGINVRL